MFFVCVFFVLFLFFIFIKISKFALPGVMLMYERTSNERKKEREPVNIIKQMFDFLMGCRGWGTSQFISGKKGTCAGPGIFGRGGFQAQLTEIANGLF